LGALAAVEFPGWERGARKKTLGAKRRERR